MSETKTNTIGRDFTLPELIKFVAPPVMTRLLVSFLSTLDDSLFVSRYCGPNALAAFSVAMPGFMFMDALGMLIGATTTVCSIKMGEKKNEEAKSDFTTMVMVAFGIGGIFTLVLTFFLNQILLMLGETEALLPYAESYMNVARFYIPMIMMSYIFNSFYVIAGKPKWSMYASAINIFCQLFFDWLFIAKLNTGIVGAAYANLIGNSCTTLLALFFYSNQEREICFASPRSKLGTLLKQVIRYGRVQFLTSIAVAFSSFVSNLVHLSIGGETIVAAYTIVSNVTFMFMNSEFGLIGSLSPIAAYAYGEKNARKFAKVCRQAVILVESLSLLIIILIISGRSAILFLYLSENSDPFIRAQAAKGLLIYPLTLLFFGFNVLVQDFANVVGRHKLSTFLSVMENIVIQISLCLLLPKLFGVDGIWFVFLSSEILTFFLTAYFVWTNAGVYGYGKDGIASFVNE